MEHSVFIKNAASNQIIKLGCSGVLYRHSKRFTYGISQILSFLTFNLKINLCNHCTYHLSFWYVHISLWMQIKSTHYFYYYSTENPKGVPYFKAPHQLYTFTQINNIIRAQVSLKHPLKTGFSRQISDERIPLCNFAKMHVRGGIGLLTKLPWRLLSPSLSTKEIFFHEFTSLVIQNFYTLQCIIYFFVSSLCNFLIFLLQLYWRI